MVKSILLSVVFVLISLYAYSNIRSDNSEDLSYLEKAELAVALSDSFVGIREIGNNQGFNNKPFERMMRTVGWRPGNAWCAFVLKLNYLLAGIQNTITGWSPSAYNKSNVVFTNGKLYKPIQPGDAGTLSYNKFKGKPGRYKGIGHAFIVIKQINGSAVLTGEGNTDSGASREGNGYYQKIRPLNANLHITRWDKK
jgi:hypothetical protein